MSYQSSIGETEVPLLKQIVGQYGVATQDLAETEVPLLKQWLGGIINELSPSYDNTYLQPDGSLYFRPDGTSIYHRP